MLKNCVNISHHISGSKLVDQLRNEIVVGTVMFRRLFASFGLSTSKFSDPTSFNIMQKEWKF